MLPKINTMICLLVAAAAIGMGTSLTHGAQPPQTLGPQWAVLAGDDALEQTAARDLRDELKDRFDLELRMGARGTAGRPRIVIGTPETHPLVARAHAEEPFMLADEPESYHNVLRGDVLFLVGASPKGAMNAAFRFLDRATLEVADFDEHGSPAFRYRIGDHLRTQRPPDDWSEVDQARYYARNYINVLWGEKFGPPLPYEVRKQYGLRLMLEVPVPRVLSQSRMRDPENAEAIYEFEHWGQTQRTVDPFHPKGRDIYREAFQRLVDENPDTAVLSTIVGDYSHVPRSYARRPSDGERYGRGRQETILELLDIMDEVIGDRDILPAFWFWHAFESGTEKRAFMNELRDAGYGIYYNEAGNADCWLTKENNFNPLALSTSDDGQSEWGENYIILLSAGGTCESLRQSVGMPLPRMAGSKMNRIASSGIQNFSLWWGSMEGWTYQANNAVISEMIWNPDAYDAEHPEPLNPEDPEPLIERVTQRDFGDLTPDVIEFYRLLDHALVTRLPLYQADRFPEPEEGGMHIFSWFQRTGVFVGFWAAHEWGMDPAAVRRQLRNNDFRGYAVRADAIANFSVVLENVDAAIAQLKRTIAQADASADGLPPRALWRLETMNRNVRLFRHVFAMQLNHMRAARIVHRNRELDDDSPELYELLAPIAKEEIANTRELIDLLSHFQDRFVIGIGVPQVEGVSRRDGSIRKLEQKLEKLKGFVDHKR